MRDVIAWTLSIISVLIAIPAQALMFLAETIGDKADEWID